MKWVVHVRILEEKRGGFDGEKAVNWEPCACRWW